MWEIFSNYKQMGKHFWENLWKRLDKYLWEMKMGFKQRYGSEKEGEVLASLNYGGYNIIKSPYMPWATLHRFA